MKKLLICLLAAHLCTLHAMQQDLENDLDRRGTLPEKEVVIKSICRFSHLDFPEFVPAHLPEKKAVADQLARQSKSQREVRNILSACSALYFKKRDQPTGRNHFERYINQIARELVTGKADTVHNPVIPYESHKWHPHSKL